MKKNKTYYTIRVIYPDCKYGYYSQYGYKSLILLESLKEARKVNKYLCVSKDEKKEIIKVKVGGL